MDEGAIEVLVGARELSLKHLIAIKIASLGYAPFSIKSHETI